MQNFEKQQIAELGRQHKEEHGIGNKELARLSHVSATNISFMLSDSEEWKNRKISDSLWRKLGEYLGYFQQGADNWKFIPTQTSNRVMGICQIAQSQSIAVGICGPRGAGKSGALKQYLHAQPRNTYYLECRSSWKQSTFLDNLMSILDIKDKPTSIAAKEEAIIKHLNSRSNPIVMLDEVNELPDAAFRTIKSLFNGTEFKCGFVFCGGLNFKRRMDNGLKYRKTSYEEIYSRMGGEVMEVQPPSRAEFHKIVQGNGAPESKINELVNTSFSDLRIARRKVTQELMLKQMV